MKEESTSENAQNAKENTQNAKENAMKTATQNEIDAMKNKQGMSEIAKIEMRFLAWARAHGLNHKVAGDTAYSSRAMGMGRYAKLVSAKGGQLLIAVDGKRVTA